MVGDTGMRLNQIILTGLHIRPWSKPIGSEEHMGVNTNLYITHPLGSEGYDRRNNDGRPTNRSRG